MDRPMAPTAYVAEDGLVGHQMGGEALGPAKAGPPKCRGMSGQGGGKAGMDGWGNTLIEEGERGCDKGFMNEKPGKGITFEM